MKRYMHVYFVQCLFAVGVASAMPASASIVLDNTRVVYKENDREVSVKLSNTGASPVVVQSWIDADEVAKDPSLIKVPFVLMPPMTRVEPGKGQTLRLVYDGEALPKDRESVYYLNVLEIPPKPVSKEQNTVQVALRTRIKLFFRGADIEGSSSDAPGRLTWSLSHEGTSWALVCTNPTSYYVSMAKISILTSGGSVDVGSGMVAPREKLSIQLKSQPGPLSKIEFSALDDYGALRESSSPLVQ